VRTALALVVLLVVGFYASQFVLPVGWHPCQEDLAAEHPRAAFEVEPGDGGAVTVTHVGGATIAPGNDRSLAVRVTDAETGAVSRTVWVDGAATDSVGPGAELTLGPDALPDAPPAAGDEVSVVWRGTVDDTPAVCPAHYDEERAVLARHTVGEASGLVPAPAYSNS
jgi:hypothetical protein